MGKIPNWAMKLILGIESSAIVVVRLGEEVRMKSQVVKIAVRVTTTTKFGRPCPSSSFCVI